MPLQTGNLLTNRYRIERILGQGGMGAVYLALDESLGVPVAVKENLNVSPESERQFRREATLLASLRHPNLPRVTDHFVLGSQQYLVMDYVEGEDLKERLARGGQLSEAEALRWGGQICDALIYLHGLTPPVVHRDIKPGNIKLDAHGNAMLVDFGIAKAASSGQKTTTGAAAFTPGYAPPEQYGMGRTDPRTDQFALAATLYTLLTGHTPPDSMERLLGNTALTPPEQLRPDLSPALAAALTRALELKPEQRFETVAKFKDVMLGRAPITQPTRRVDADATRVRPDAPGASTVKADAAATLASPEAAGPAPTPAPARPAWLLPAGLGAGALLVIGIVAVVAVMLNNPGAAPTASPPPATTLAVAAVTDTAAPPTATDPPPSATSAPSDTPVPLPTETATPEPPTATLAPPTAAPTQVGGGGRIAFISNRDGQHFQVYTMNPDGSDVRQVTSDPTDKWSPNWQLGRLGPFAGSTFLAWSPDGQRLMYSAEIAPGGAIDLFVINADGTNPVNITAPTSAGRPNENDFQPAWCQDGTIAFTSLRNNSPQVFIIPSLDNREARNYSTSRANPLEYNPLFFADCRRMLVISTQNGAGELWRLFPSRQAQAAMWATFPAYPGANNENSYRIFLSELPQGNVILDAALAPDDTQFVFTRQSPGAQGNTLILGTVENSPLQMKFQQLTEARSDTSPQWSADGRYLTFVSKRDGGLPQVFRMTSGGLEEINLSARAGGAAFTELSPAWQPTPAPAP
ncbi:MAG: serine/threonine-protein kinase [Anaerolineales bacterium]|nr:serine/threonine-protein kinase [Anaerolineales bacterium]